MTIDAELQRHKETWHGFTTFLKLGTAAVVVTLILMAIFLL
ncbi:MAG TPA: aa3-type cytochrome c oxidase subunit IV [Stellaceae bacterium]|nr:aa3-type cytochrome c oxidase subunit IV [Stellaceae bacterium]